MRKNENISVVYMQSGLTNVLGPYVDINDGRVCAERYVLPVKHDFRYGYSVRTSGNGYFYSNFDSKKFATIIEAKTNLDLHLLYYGFILCDTEEEFEKYKVLL